MFGESSHEDKSRVKSDCRAEEEGDGSLRSRYTVQGSCLLRSDICVVPASLFELVVKHYVGRLTLSLPHDEIKVLRV